VNPSWWGFVKAAARVAAPRAKAVAKWSAKRIAVADVQAIGADQEDLKKDEDGSDRIVDELRKRMRADAAAERAAAAPAPATPASSAPTAPAAPEASADEQAVADELKAHVKAAALQNSVEVPAVPEPAAPTDP
jgi:hypothetical protein